MTRVRRRLLAFAAPVVTAGLVLAGTAAPASAVSPISDDDLSTAQINGVAYAQVVTHNTVYVGGSFTTARPAGADPGEDTVRRSNLLAYDLTTGRLKDWAPKTNGVVRGLAKSSDGKTIYAVGTFTKVNSEDRLRIVALAASTGGVRQAFHPTMNASGYSVAVHGDTVYTGGIFTSASGTKRTRAAAFDRVTGKLRTWSPVVNDTVNALVVSPTGSSVVLGGRFSKVNGKTAYGTARVSGVGGKSVYSWPVNQLIGNHGDDAGITSLASDGQSVYASGYAFDSGIDQKKIEGVFSTTWKGKLRWIEDCHGDTYSVAASRAAVYVAGHPHDCRNVPHGFVGDEDDTIYHRALAFTKVQRGNLDPNEVETYKYSNFGDEPAPAQFDWMPDFNTGTVTGANQGPWSVATYGDWVVYGGEFTTVNGHHQQGLVRFHK